MVSGPAVIDRVRNLQTTGHEKRFGNDAKASLLHCVAVGVWFCLREREESLLRMNWRGKEGVSEGVSCIVADVSSYLAFAVISKQCNILLWGHRYFF